jgi:hypothetical protein
VSDIRAELGSSEGVPVVGNRKCRLVAVCLASTGGAPCTVRVDPIAVPRGPPGGAMSDANPWRLSGLARTILALVIVLIVAGVVLHGISAGVWHRFFHDLIERPNGPMRFRFILQPTMAAIAALRDGRADAVAGRAPFVWTMLGRPEERGARLREALNATARIVLLGVVMDVIYQVLVLKTFYPAEAAVIALVLAFLPYAIIRGLVLRVLRSRISAPRAP